MQFARSFLLACAKSPWEDEEVAEESIRLLAYFNEKEDIRFLITVLHDQTCYSRHVSVLKALQYLCSGDKLIRGGDDELQPEFWSRQQSQLPQDSINWLIHDAESVFWEKRLWVANKIRFMNTIPEYQNLMEKLRNDEVLTTRSVFEKK